MLNYQIQLDLSDKKIRSQFQSLLGDFAKEVKNESISIQMNWDSKSIHKLYEQANKIVEKMPEIGVPFKFELSKQMLAEMKAQYNHIFDYEDNDSAKRATEVIKELSKEYEQINKQIQEAQKNQTINLIPKDTLQRFETVKSDLMRMRDTLSDLKGGDTLFAKLPAQVRKVIDEIEDLKDWEFNPFEVIKNDDKRAYPKKIAELNELKEMIKAVETEMANLGNASELNVGKKIEKSVKSSKAKDEISEIKQALVELKNASDTDINLKLTINDALKSIEILQRKLADIPNPKEIQVKVVKSEDFDQQLQHIQEIINSSVGKIDIKLNGSGTSSNRVSSSQNDNFIFTDKQIDSKKKKLKDLVETIDNYNKQLKDKNPVYDDKARLYLDTNKQINIQKKSTEDLNKILEKQLSIYKDITSARRNTKEIEHKTSSGDTITGIPTVESIEAQRNRIAAVISLLNERGQTDPTKALEAMAKKDQKTIENALKVYEASKSSAKAAESFAKESADIANQNPRKLINKAKNSIETILQQTNGKAFDRNGINTLLDNLQSGKLTVDQVTESLQNMMAVVSTGTTAPVQSQNILQNEIKETQEQTEQTAQVVDSTSQTLVQDFEQIAEASEDTTKAVEQTVSTLKEYAKLRAEAGTLKNPLDAGFSNYTGQSRTGTYTQLKILSESQKEGELDNAKLANEILEKAGLFTTTGDLKLIHEMEELVDQLSGGGRKLEGIKSRTKKILEDNLNSLREQFEKGAEEAIEEISTKKNPWTKIEPVSRKEFKKIWLKQNPWLSDPDSIKQNFKRALEEKEKAGQAYTLPPTGRQKKGKYVVEVEVELTNEEKLEKQLQIIKDKWQSGELSKQQVGYLYSKYVENGGQEKLSSIATNKKEAADLISAYKEVEKAIQAKRQAEEQALQTSQQVANAYDNEEDEILAAQRAYDQMAQEIGTISGVQDEAQREFDETSQKISNIVPSGSLSSWEQLINLLKRLTDQINAYLVAQGIIPEEIKAVDISQDGVQKELEETTEEAKKATLSLEELEKGFAQLKRISNKGNKNLNDIVSNFILYRQKGGSRGLAELESKNFGVLDLFKEYEKQAGQVPANEFNSIVGSFKGAFADAQNEAQKELAETAQESKKTEYSVEELAKGFEILQKKSVEGSISLKDLLECFKAYKQFGGKKGLVDLVSINYGYKDMLTGYANMFGNGHLSNSEIDAINGETKKVNQLSKAATEDSSYIRWLNEVGAASQVTWKETKELADEFEILKKNVSTFDIKTLVQEFRAYESKGGSQPLSLLATSKQHNQLLHNYYESLEREAKQSVDDAVKVGQKVKAYTKNALEKEFNKLLSDKDGLNRKEIVSRYRTYLEHAEGVKGYNTRELSELAVEKKHSAKQLQNEFEKQLAKENEALAQQKQTSKETLETLLPLIDVEKKVAQEGQKVAESQNETNKTTALTSARIEKLTSDYNTLQGIYQQRKSEAEAAANAEEQVAKSTEDVAQSQDVLQKELSETSEVEKKVINNAQTLKEQFKALKELKNTLPSDVLVAQYRRYQEEGGTNTLRGLASKDKYSTKELQAELERQIAQNLNPSDIINTFLTKVKEAKGMAGGTTAGTSLPVNVEPVVPNAQEFINKITQILSSAEPVKIKADLDIDPAKLEKLGSTISNFKFDGAGLKNLNSLINSLANQKTDKLQTTVDSLNKIHEALNKNLGKNSIGRALSELGGQTEGLKALVNLMKNYEKAMATIEKVEEEAKANQPFTEDEKALHRAYTQAAQYEEELKKTAEAERQIAAAKAEGKKQEAAYQKQLEQEQKARQSYENWWQTALAKEDIANKDRIKYIQETLQAISNSGQVTGQVQTFNELSTSVADFARRMQSLPTMEVKGAIDKLSEGVKSLKNELSQVADPTKVDALRTRINTLLDTAKKASASSRAEAESILQNLVPNKTTKGELSSFSTQFSALLDKMKRGGELALTFGDRWKRGLSSLARYLTTFASFYRIVGLIRQSFDTVKTLDDALIDLKKTTEMTNTELEQFYYNSSNIAKQTGVTTEEIISQAAAWSRLGYSSKEASEEMAALSSQFAQISPGMSVDTATDGLVSSMKAFGIEVDDVERKIMDNVNRIGNTMATTNEEIVEMLTRSSAAMNAANNSIEETIALESAAVQITRNAETTGTAFRTISMRIRGKLSMPPYTERYMLCYA